MENGGWLVCQSPWQKVCLTSFPKHPSSHLGLTPSCWRPAALPDSSQPPPGNWALFLIFSSRLRSCSKRTSELELEFYHYRFSLYLEGSLSTWLSFLHADILGYWSGASLRWMHIFRTIQFGSFATSSCVAATLYTYSFALNIYQLYYVPSDVSQWIPSGKQSQHGSRAHGNYGS